jgi:hypothetical protein
MNYFATPNKKNSLVNTVPEEMVDNLKKAFEMVSATQCDLNVLSDQYQNVMLQGDTIFTEVENFYKELLLPTFKGFIVQPRCKDVLPAVIVGMASE